MDFIKKAAADFSSGNKGEQKPVAEGSAQQQTTGTTTTDGQPAQNVQKDDYVDKAFSAIASKSGYNIDRNTQEKITDGGRSAYEKYSGSKVSDNISN